MATEYTHSMPTPPFSPKNMAMPDAAPDTGIRSTGPLLDSLVSFYQHERMWVYRTRATLEDAFTPPITDGPHNQSYPSRDQHQMLYPPESGPTQDGQATRWNRRKKGFKLRLEGIRARKVINTQPPGQGEDAEQMQPREQILEMFEKMMEARMESCQRVNKLVRDANRANLHYR